MLEWYRPSSSCEEMDKVINLPRRATSGATAVHPDGQYVHSKPASTLLTSASPEQGTASNSLQLSDTALSAINQTLDELLHSFLSVALLGHSTPLGAQETLPIEHFRKAVVKIVGPSLGNDVVANAEIALRELLRRGPPRLRADPSLRTFIATDFPSTGYDFKDQIEEIFVALRVVIRDMSSLAGFCPAWGPTTLVDHVQLLLKRPIPIPASHVSFVLTFYAERIVSFIATKILTVCAHVAGSRTDVVTVGDLQDALSADESLWKWARTLKVAKWIEQEVEVERELERKNLPSGGSGVSPGGSYSLKNGGGGGDVTSVLEKELDDRLRINNNPDALFEKFAINGETTKVTLTSDRMRSLEIGPRDLSTSQAASSTVQPLYLNTQPVPVRRLVARSPRREVEYGAEDDDNDNDDDRDDVDDFDLSRAPRPRKESLFELLSSPPPWSTEGVQARAQSQVVETNNSTSAHQRDGRGPPVRVPPALAPESEPVSPRQTTSLTTSQAHSIEYNFFQGSSYHDHWQSPAGDIQLMPAPPPKPPSKHQVSKLQAKDDREDPWIERSINYDLVDFFVNSAPPTSPLPTLPGLSPAGLSTLPALPHLPSLPPTPTSPLMSFRLGGDGTVDGSSKHHQQQKQRRGGVRGFVSRTKAQHKSNEE